MEPERGVYAAKNVAGPALVRKLAGMSGALAIGRQKQSGQLLPGKGWGGG